MISTYSYIGLMRATGRCVITSVTAIMADHWDQCPRYYISQYYSPVFYYTEYYWKLKGVRGASEGIASSRSVGAAPET